MIGEFGKVRLVVRAAGKGLAVKKKEEEDFMEKMLKGARISAKGDYGLYADEFEDMMKYQMSLDGDESVYFRGAAMSASVRARSARISRDDESIGGCPF